MAKRKQQGKALPAGRAKVTAEGSLKRMEEFARRKVAFIDSVRKGKDRGASV